MVSPGGDWMVGSCQTHLLLLQVPGGIMEARCQVPAFRLALSEAHLAPFRAEIGTTDFGVTRFYVKRGRTFVVATVGVFTITWSVRRLENKAREAYIIKRHQDETTALEAVTGMESI
jgi:hypothetical protein